jgi:hypothetical protein
MTTTEMAVRVHLKGGSTVVYHQGRRVSRRFKSWNEAGRWAVQHGYTLGAHFVNGVEGS